MSKGVNMLIHLFRRFKHRTKVDFSVPPVHTTEELSTEQAVRNEMWYCLREALRGDKEAQYRMGLSYLNGELGLDQSFIHAEKWLDQAAHQGHTEAKHELEKAYTRLVFS